MTQLVVRPITQTRIILRENNPIKIEFRETPGVVRLVQAAAPFAVQSVGDLRRAGFVVGDGVQTVFALTHNFSTYDVTVDLIRNSGNREDFIVDVARPTTNTVAITFREPPPVDGYRVLVTG